MDADTDPPHSQQASVDDLQVDGGAWIENSHALGVDEVLARLTVDEDTGLSHEEVTSRRRRFGFNRLREAAGTST